MCASNPRASYDVDCGMLLGVCGLQGALRAQGGHEMQRGCQRCARLVQQVRRRREGGVQASRSKRACGHAGGHKSRRACGVGEREGTQPGSEIRRGIREVNIGAWRGHHLRNRAVLDRKVGGSKFPGIQPRPIFMT